MSSKKKPIQSPPKDFPETIGGNPTPTSKVGSDPTVEPPLPKVRDSYGRLVSTKKANQPFLAYGRWKTAQAAKAARKKEREEKRARGEPVDDDEEDEEETLLWALTKLAVLFIAFVALGGKFITGSFVWGYDGKWVNWRTYWPETQRLFSESSLAKYDGTNPHLPLYIAIDGDVYDVSVSRRIYGPGGSYHLMAGIDAARAYGTGCFETHRTHDLRGLDEGEMKGVLHWKKFFAESTKYHKVGRVQHRPIDPLSPIPEHCNADKQAAAAAASASKNKAAQEENQQKGTTGKASGEL